jgi:hypothetical protein
MVMENRPKEAEYEELKRISIVLRSLGFGHVGWPDEITSPIRKAAGHVDNALFYAVKYTTFSERGGKQQ